MKRKTTWSTVAIDFEMTTATKIPTARGQAKTQGASPETDVEEDNDFGRLDVC